MKSYYTTSQAAKILSVSPDTVLKWVRAGKISSYRTPGGHSRIPAEAISALLPEENTSSATVEADESQAYRYCWDYYAEGNGVRSECRDCVVYKSQARRCYEMRSIPEEFGHLKLFCQTSCDECEFFQLTHNQARSFLVVTRSAALRKTLQTQAYGQDVRIEFAGSEYDCASSIEKFRPDFIILDTAFGKSRTKRICEHLSRDERIPFARIILTSRHPRLAEECKHEVFGWIEKPFTVDKLGEFIDGTMRASRNGETVA